MRRLIAGAALAAFALVNMGIECNGISSEQVSTDIIRTVEQICGSREGVRNIMLMEKRDDDGIVTCMDGTNHYFDG